MIKVTAKCEAGATGEMCCQPKARPIDRHLPLLLGASLCLLVVFSPMGAVALDPTTLADALLNKSQADHPFVSCRVELPRFYRQRQFRPAWLTAEDRHRMISDLLAVVQSIDADGLRPADYHLADILKLLGGSRLANLPNLSGEDAVVLELLLTDTFLLLGSHLAFGRINPVGLDPEWFAERRDGNIPELLEDALSSGNITAALMSQLPAHEGYRRLKAAYGLFLAAVDTDHWPQVPEGVTLRIGDRSDRVRLLRKRLSVQAGESSAVSGDSDRFDAEVAAALIRFQMDHGLVPDGLAGPRTLKVLNVPIEYRLRQIAANLERWRWLPERLGHRYIMVNIADYALEVFEGDRRLLQMGVVVGKPYRHTPVFSGLVRSLVFNPSWHVPHRIAVEDKLPIIRADPDYFSREGMRLFAGSGNGLQEIDPSTVDWPRMSKTSFGYRLVQAPGPRNALGRVKFLFPNRFNVYLHDTPNHEFFSRMTRNFSSGCVRLEKPIVLAELLLKDNSGWDMAHIDAVLAAGKETPVNLKQPINVHLLYWTAFVDADNRLRFREDVYGRDRKLIEAMLRPQA